MFLVGGNCTFPDSSSADELNSIIENGKFECFFGLELAFLLLITCLDHFKHLQCLHVKA